MNNMPELTTVLSGLSFTECPRWHDGRLWLSDFYTNQVLSAAADGSGLRTELEVPQQPGGIGWLPDGRLLVVSAQDHRILRRELDGDVVVHADLSEHVPGGNLNDMVVDSHGRAYVGNFGFDLAGGAKPATTSLIRVDVEGGVEQVADDLWFPNGAVVTDDGVLLVNETLGNRVTAFDIDAHGDLRNRRVWAKFGDVPAGDDIVTMITGADVAPDGSCLDAEGALWIADALHGKAIRVREGGEVIDEVQADSGVFACMLGGGEGRTLFLCTAPDFDPAARSAARESQVLATRVSVPHGGRP
jgi:sugar lactone lactonase YvrE